MCLMLQLRRSSYSVCDGTELRNEGLSLLFKVINVNTKRTRNNHNKVEEDGMESEL